MKLFKVLETQSRRTSTYTVKYVDDPVLLDKEGTVIQGMTDRLAEIGKCYGIGLNV
jgi:hypothetical protein